MKDFAKYLTEEIAFYEGRHDDLIHQAPALYCLLTKLLDDPRLPGRLRPLILAAVAYFILPVDVLSEEMHGPYGYLDDILLCAFVLKRIEQELGSAAILADNWEGEAPLRPLIDDLLGRVEELIGDRMPAILQYIGYEYLKAT